MKMGKIKKKEDILLFSNSYNNSHCKTNPKISQELIFATNTPKLKLLTNKTFLYWDTYRDKY